MSDIRDFGAVGDGQTDCALAIEHALSQHDGILEFPKGEYLLSRTVQVHLESCGPLTIKGIGGAARLIMAGAGPALRWVGTHQGTAAPSSVSDVTWERERSPKICDLEIVGEHPEADGLELFRCWQPNCVGLSIHNVRHGIRIAERNRNVIIDRCHIYHNTGVGVFLDQVNLHQINIVGSHISYNRLGGIRIENSEVRNLQITGNDIEYNNAASHDVQPDVASEPTAEIYISCGEKGSMREITISSNTIQATASPQGANIRLIGSPDVNHRIGMLTISGNLIGSQESNVWATRCRGLVLSGNYIYGAEFRNVCLEECENVSLTGNCIGANPDYQVPVRQVSVRLERCDGVSLTGDIVEAMPPVDLSRVPQDHQPALALIEIDGCRSVAMSNCQLIDAIPSAIDVRESHLVTVDHCQMTNRRAETERQWTLQWQGQGEYNAVRNCVIQSGTEGGIRVSEEAGVTQSGNLEVPVQ